MVAKINAGVSVKGAIAYQDDVDETQFHYFPSAPKLTLEDQLEAFSVTYWGIGARPYYSQNPDTEEISSQVGAILSGQVIFDVANAQKRDLENKIEEIYGIGNPKLIPFMLLNTEVVPVFASQVLGIESDGQATFPTVVQTGSRQRISRPMPRPAKRRSGSTSRDSIAWMASKCRWSERRAATVPNRPT